MFCSTWMNMMRHVETPSARAASMNSSSRITSVDARTTRATRGV